MFVVNPLEYVLFDPVYCHKDVPPSLPDVPTVSVIKATVAAFKESQNAPRKTAAD